MRRASALSIALVSFLAGCAPQTNAGRPSAATASAVGMTLDKFNEAAQRTPERSFENGHGKTFVYAGPMPQCRLVVETDRIAPDRSPQSYRIVATRTEGTCATS